MFAMLLLGLVGRHEIYRTLLRNYLEQKGGYKVIFDTSEESELIEGIEQVPVRPDVILLDLNQLIRNGLQTVHCLKCKYPGIKIILLNGFSSGLLFQEMFRSGVDCIILKTANIEVICETIECVSKGLKMIAEGSGNLIEYSFTAGNRLAYNSISLSVKQLDFIKLCAMPDSTYKSIADTLKISPKTADRYREVLFKKLNVRSRTGLAIYALQNGIVDLASLM